MQQTAPSTTHHALRPVSPWAFRLRRAGVHLALSLVLVGALAAAIFLVWYPEPYRSLSGGLHLFTLLVVVDIALGPCATLVVSNPTKPLREWRTDMAVIILVQLLALAYGAWTVFQARPVYLAFEIDRFRAIHAVDIPRSLLHKAPPGMESLPLTGPKRVAVRAFRDEQERIDATFAALSGVHLGARPDLWMPYEAAVQTVLASAEPVSTLIGRRPRHQPLIQSALAAAGLTPEQVVFLPLVVRHEFWTVLINRQNAEPVAYLPVDPYDP